MLMNDDQLVELIASRVRARLMAGGQGPGYTRATGSESNETALQTRSPYEPGNIQNHEAAECDEGCGMCISSRPEDAAAMLKIGADRIGTSVDLGKISGGLASYIDHTLLKPEATREQLSKLADEARAHRFATVCVNSVNVRLMTQLLRGSSVPVCAVVGFPLGAMSPRSKAYETKEAIRCGAKEIDMVINIGALKSGDYGLVLRDIQAVVDAARPISVKVILETSKLTHEEKVIACALSKSANAAFVKTSTGFGGGGATVDDVTMMRRIVGAEMGVKASGGVRNQDDAKKMIQAGANRIGASASVAIVTGGTSKGGY